VEVYDDAGVIENASVEAEAEADEEPQDDADVIEFADVGVGTDSELRLGADEEEAELEGGAGAEVDVDVEMGADMVTGVYAGIKVYSIGEEDEADFALAGDVDMANVEDEDRDWF